MSGNRIWNVATPTSSLDAANKAYVDSAFATTSIAHVWGQGRPGAAFVAGTACTNTAECYRDLNGSESCNAGDIKISRSSRPAAWDKAAAACPTGSWVCSAADRGTAACGTGVRTYVDCRASDTNINTYLDDFVTYTPNLGGTNAAWLADVSPLPNNASGTISLTTGGAVGSTAICSQFPVWCCRHQ